MEFSQQQHYSPQAPAQASVSSLMLNVMLALIPGIIVLAVALLCPLIARWMQ